MSLTGYEGAEKTPADILDMGALRASCQDRAEAEAARFLSEARSNADKVLGGEFTLWRPTGSRSMNPSDATPSGRWWPARIADPRPAGPRHEGHPGFSSCLDSPVERCRGGGCA